MPRKRCSSLRWTFERKLRVIPVVIEGATMPDDGDVPASLRPLCYRTAVPLRPDPDFKNDIQQLVLALRSSEEPGLSGAPIVA